jgi:hypothetical protein
VKGVGEPCAGEPHARFDGRGLETERYSVTAPAPDPTNLPAHLGERLDALERVLPHTERMVLHGQGHAANVFAPGKLADVIAGFAEGVLRR